VGPAVGGRGTSSVGGGSVVGAATSGSLDDLCESYATVFTINMTDSFI
jgi:hypothetical protein